MIICIIEVVLSVTSAASICNIDNRYVDNRCDSNRSDNCTVLLLFYCKFTYFRPQKFDFILDPFVQAHIYIWKTLSVHGLQLKRVSEVTKMTT